MNDYRQVNDVEYWSQELRLNSPADGKVTWFAGASIYEEKIDGYFDYIYDEDALCRAISITEAPDFCRSGRGLRRSRTSRSYWEDDIDPADILEDKTERSYVDVKSQGWAVYGDFTWAISDRLELTAGARYTYDKKEMDEPGPRFSGGALGNNFNFEFFTNGIVSDTADWERLHAAPRALLRRQRRRHALRDGLDGLQVRRLRDLRLRPARPGHQRRRLGPGRHDAARVRPRAGGQLRDRRQDAAARQHAAG